MTKAKDWEFISYTPDVEDVEAQGKCLTAFVNLHYKHPLKMTPAEERIHYFVSGFFRGCAWMQTKLGQAPAIEVVWAVGINHKPHEFGMIAGPYLTEKEALDFIPTLEHQKERKGIYILEMTGNRAAGQEPEHQIKYRWHRGSSRWVPSIG